MISQEVRDILEKLLERSRAGNVNWLSADDLGAPNATEETYSVVTPEATINIWKSKQVTTIYGNILNSKGDEVVNFDSTGSDYDYKNLSELFALARKKALKVDEILAGLRKFLVDNRVIGKLPSEALER